LAGRLVAVLFMTRWMMLYTRVYTGKYIANCILFVYGKKKLKNGWLRSMGCLLVNLAQTMIGNRCDEMLTAPPFTCVPGPARVGDTGMAVSLVVFWPSPWQRPAAIIFLYIIASCRYHC